MATRNRRSIESGRGVVSEEVRCSMIVGPRSFPSIFRNLTAFGLICYPGRFEPARSSGRIVPHHSQRAKLMATRPIILSLTTMREEGMSLLRDAGDLRMASSLEPEVLHR